MNDWNEIDHQRRKRRLTKTQRDTKYKEFKENTNNLGEERFQAPSSCNPFIPQDISDLQIGSLAKVISAVGSRVSPGIIRYETLRVIMKKG